VFSGTESAVREMPLRLDPVGSVSGAPSTNQAATPTPGFVGGGGAGPAMPSTATGGPTTPLPSANPNYPRNDPRVPVPRHEVPPGVTPPPWLGNPPGTEPPQGEVTSPPESTNPVPAPAPTPPPMPTPPPTPGAN